MSRYLIVLLSLILIAPFGFGQDKKADSSVKMEGPSGFVKVEIILDNEAVFQGLVDKDRMVEVVKRHRYVRLKSHQRKRFGAGVRLWYYDGLAGFLFFPYRHIAEVKMGKELSMRQLALVESKASELRAKREQAAAERAKAKMVVAAKKANASPLDDASQALLDRWSPQKGWTEEKFGDMQKRAITEGYEFSTEEAAWAKIYPDWLKALRLKQAPAKVAEVAPKKPAPKTAKLVTKKKPNNSKPATSKARTVTADKNGRIHVKINRPKKRPQGKTSGAARGIR